MESTKNIFKGVGISLILTIILLFIFSLILAYTNVNENTITPVIRKNGILNGGAIGGIYLLIIYTISSILNWKFNLNIQSIIMILVGTTFGILGGVIGVNIK